MEHVWSSREVDGHIDWYTEHKCLYCGIHRGARMGDEGEPFGYLPALNAIRFDHEDCHNAQAQLRGYLEGRLDAMRFQDIGCVPVYHDALRAGFTVAKVIEVLVEKKLAWPADIALAFGLPLPKPRP